MNMFSTVVSLTVQAMLLSARWAGRRRHLCLEQAAAHPYLGQIERCAAGLPKMEAAQLLLEHLKVAPWGEADEASPPYYGDVAVKATGRYEAVRGLKRAIDQLPTDAVSHLADVAKSLAKLTDPEGNAPRGKSASGSE